jgi:hypothetical protein
LNAIEIARGPAIFDVKIVSLLAAEVFQGLPEGEEPGAPFRVGIAILAAHDGGNPPNARGLLRACRKRPSCRRTAEQPDELAPPHIRTKVSGQHCID